MDRDAVQEDLEHLEEVLDDEETHFPEVALEVPVSELHMRADVVAVADIQVLDRILIPRHADWSIGFAGVAFSNLWASSIAVSSKRS